MSATKGRMPNFLIIGAARAGTSSLYEYMRQHPDIFFSANKEPMFFAFEGKKVDFKGPGDDKEINAKSITNLAEYQQLFADAGSQKAIGEASASYLYSERAPERIHHHIPDAKLIAVLRNPVERAYSSFLYMTRDHREPLNNFAEALAHEEERIAANWEHIWHYRKSGFYFEQLSRYYKLFDRDQIKVYLNEEMRKDTGAVTHDAFKFLGVDDSFQADTSVQFNAGGIPKRAFLNRLLTRQSRLKSLLKPITPAFVMKMYIGLKNSNLDKPELLADVRQELAKGYEQDILQLQDLIQKDLSAWLPE